MGWVKEAGDRAREVASWVRQGVRFLALWCTWLEVWVLVLASVASIPAYLMSAMVEGDSFGVRVLQFLIGVFATLPVVVSWASLVANARQRVRLCERLVELHEVTPSGAPRMAVVQCSEGRRHRFLYGPNGWQEAGPSTEDVPEPVVR